MRQFGAIALDDLLLFWSEMASDPELSIELGARFDHVLVDEYQDATNKWPGATPREWGHTLTITITITITMDMDMDMDVQQRMDGIFVTLGF